MAQPLLTFSSREPARVQLVTENTRPARCQLKLHVAVLPIRWKEFQDSELPALGSRGCCSRRRGTTPDGADVYFHAFLTPWRVWHGFIAAPPATALLELEMELFNNHVSQPNLHVKSHEKFSNHGKTRWIGVTTSAVNMQATRSKLQPFGFWVCPKHIIMSTRPLGGRGLGIHWSPQTRSPGRSQLILARLDNSQRSPIYFPAASFVNMSA